MNQKHASILLNTVFLTLLCGIALFSILLPDRTYSETERRTLQSMPELSAKALTTRNQNEKFSQKYEEYVADQFLFRDGFVALKNRTEVLLGKKDFGGVWLGKDEYLFSKEVKINEGNFKQNLNEVATFLQNSEEKLALQNIAVTFVPDAAHVYPEKLPAFASAYDFNIVQSAANTTLSVRYTDVFQTLSEHKDEDIYYRTDHHWTSLGAYYAYAALADSLGYVANPLTDYTPSVVSENFRGTLASKINLPTATDTITKYTFRNTFSCTMQTADGIQNSIYDDSALNGSDQYNYFLGGVKAYHKIKTNANNNRRLLILKDSYAHSLVPFLCDHYESIILVDLRYYTDDVFALLEEESITDLLVLYQATNFAADTSLLLLNR